MADKFTYPFRVGRKQKRAILDAHGLEVVVFNVGLEDLAELTCKFYNQHQERKKTITFKNENGVLTAISGDTPKEFVI